jgi:NADH:ubiquinone oxidoreductase subunit F (NADH-binding)
MSERRLLAGLVPGRAMSLGEHIAAHGALPDLRGRAPADLLADIEASGLRGRGGAAFPMAVKAAAAARRRRALVVVNGAEGEPMSAKDRVLMSHTPHLVLEGAIVAAAAVRAREVTIAAPADALRHLAEAISERRAAAQLPVRFRLEASAPGYVSGEESALLAHLEGQKALPRTKPPLPVERGLRGRPTLVQNVETVAQLALIARRGPEWFREKGTAQHPGTTLITISGAVEEPAVHEVPLGTPLRALVPMSGGGTETTRALLIGGYFGAWIDGDGGDLTLDDDALRAIGAGIGAGVVVALGASACPVAETARLAAWMSEESAGQCGPCVFGLEALAALLRRFAAGRTERGDVDRLVRWTSLVRGRGACKHPDGVARMIASAARVFGRELADHARHGPCSGCSAPPTLVTPDRTAWAA